MKNETKQTAVEWLVDQLEKHYVKTDLKNTVAYQQAKAMHKEEIEHFFKMGMSLVEGRLWKPIDKFDEAYNETYGGNK